MKIIFVPHSTTFDNEAKKASGHNDIDLSPLGLNQAEEVREHYKNTYISAVYCSDLQRSYKTAAIAFEGRSTAIFIDKRLRECDYGDLTQADADLVKNMRLECVSTAYPNGESYQQTCARMKSFLADLSVHFCEDDVVMIIGHRATQYGLEHHLKNLPIEKVVTDPWSWQPGWDYVLNTAK